ncbi:hypothetical protein SDJN02_02244, partial [Cucurbita argyrosperma subsp. argyrosperma]
MEDGKDIKAADDFCGEESTASCGRKKEKVDLKGFLSRKMACWKPEQIVFYLTCDPLTPPATECTHAFYFDSYNVRS